MERKFFVGGNWKMNGSKAKIDEILKNLAGSELSPSTGLFTKHIHTHSLQYACLVKLIKLSFYFAYIRTGHLSAIKLTESTIFS